MSLINDLLAKVKRQDPKMDVPPLLKEAVMQKMADRRMRSRFMIPLALAAFVAAVGVGALFLVVFSPRPAPVSQTPMKTAAVSPAVAPAGTAVQQSETAVVAAVPRADEKRSLKVTEQKTQKIKTAPVVREKETARSPVKASVVTESVQNRGETSHEKSSGKVIPDHSEKTGATSRRERDLYLYQARTHEMQKNYQGAVSSYKKVLALDPDNYIVMNNLASVLIQAGAYEEAIGHAQRALQIHKGYIFSQINLGIAYSQLGKYSEGEGYFRQALSADPSNGLALLNLGFLQERRNALDSAREIFTRLSDTGNVQGYLGLARIAEKQGKTEEAIQIYQTVMSMGNKDSSLWTIANDRLWQLSR